MKEFIKGFAIAAVIGGGVLILIGAARPMERFVRSVIHVESKGNPNAVGDQGRSRGLAQISRPYYIDACKQLKKHGITPPPYLTAVKDRYWVERLIRAYMERYCPKALAAGNLDTMSRTHNGGLAGPRTKATKGYAARVLREFNKH